MKQASIMLHLSKDTCYPKHGVTPIEAMIMTALHHPNKGDAPVVVEKDTVKDVPDKRTNDQELDRLRGIYGVAKVNAVLAQVRDLPETFEQAQERGLKIAIPTGALSSNPNAGVASSTKLI